MSYFTIPVLEPKPQERIFSCFLKFKYAHNLTDSWDALKLATECMIGDFAKENTVYLEIRSTPKQTATLSKEDYLEAIIAGIV